MNKQELIIDYKAKAYDFTQLVLKAKANEILKLTEAKEYKDMIKAAEELVNNGIEIKTKE